MIQNFDLAPIDLEDTTFLKTGKGTTHSFDGESQIAANILT